MSAEIRRCILLEDRPAAIHIEQDTRGTKVKAWIPKSQILYQRKLPAPGQGPIEITFNIPEWLADKKNLVY